MTFNSLVTVHTLQSIRTFEIISYDMLQNIIQHDYTGSDSFKRLLVKFFSIIWCDSPVSIEICNFFKTTSDLQVNPETKTEEDLKYKDNLRIEDNLKTDDDLTYKELSLPNSTSTQLKSWV